MHEKKRGLPADFEISVPEQAVRRTAVKLDDYLEREIGSERAPLSTPAKSSTGSPGGARHFRANADTEPAVSGVMRAGALQSRMSMPHQPPTFPQRFRPRPAPIKAPRVQLNMTPEVQRMVQELVGHFCTFGLQKDTSASEVFEGLVSALHESRDQLDLSDIPPRGQWGTPTARAFRTNLKNAVIDAIARHRQRLTQ